MDERFPGWMLFLIGLNLGAVLMGGTCYIMMGLL